VLQKSFLLNALTAALRAINNLHVQVLDLIRAQDDARVAAIPR
jgi:hypothetical protein